MQLLNFFDNKGNKLDVEGFLNMNIDMLGRIYSNDHGFIDLEEVKKFDKIGQFYKWVIRLYDNPEHYVKYIDKRRNVLSEDITINELVK